MNRSTMKSSDMNQLEQLRQFTTVVADTGDLDAIRTWHPQDATTNPSLLLKAASDERYRELVDTTLRELRLGRSASREQVDDAMDHLAVRFGGEILKLIDGQVSTEVDARLSFDTGATVDKARKLMDLYQKASWDRDRVLIKIAATWEGIRAAEILEREGIRCNLTLLFGFPQAQAAADAGAFLISPFVGRILDWYKNHTGRAEYAPEEDPGVLSVRRIYQHYKSQGYETVVMGASFRNRGEIQALAGCDRLTISPALLEELAADTSPLPRQLSPQTASNAAADRLEEARFRMNMNDDAMATEKLAEGIRNFIKDQETLAQRVGGWTAS